MSSSNSNQFILFNDPSGSVPFGTFNEAKEICFNTTQWLVQQQQFYDTALQFGYFCLTVAGIIGALTGYYYAKRKYTKDDADPPCRLS